MINTKRGEALQLLNHLLKRSFMHKAIMNTNGRCMRAEALAIQILHLMPHLSKLFSHIPATKITAAGTITDSDHRFTRHLITPSWLPPAHFCRGVGHGFHVVYAESLDHACDDPAFCVVALALLQAHQDQIGRASCRERV